MSTFEYIGTPCRVQFGIGILDQLPSLAETLGINAAMILSTPQQTDVADRVQSILGDVAVHVFSGATMHTPTSVTAAAILLSRELHVDGIISIGGGSTVGLGKAMSIRTSLPHVCIPTTYAGSEMTSILGETEDGQKRTRRDPKILPTAVLYDVELTKTLPVKLSIYSGINAIAHAVEALYAKNTNPITSLMATEGVRALSQALPAIQKDSQDQDARYKALYGAWLCGMCLNAADMALHHKICHTLGGTFNLPHAETHVVMLPHSIAYNASHTRSAMKKLAEALPNSEGDAIRGMQRLYQTLGITISLADLGMPENGIKKAVDMATLNPYANPRPIERDALGSMIRRAWSGDWA